MVGGIDTLNVPFAETWFFDEMNGFVQGPTLPAVARKGGMSAAFQNKFYYTCGWTTSGHTKQTWKLDLPVGLEENSILENVLYGPNPFNEELIINNNAQTKLSFQLINGLGEVICEGDCMAKEHIPTSWLPRGIYFLRVYSNERSLMKKVIKE
jgi:hypothetical protein